MCLEKPIPCLFGCSCRLVNCGSKTGISLRPWGVVGIFIPSLTLFVQDIYIALRQPSLVITRSLEEGHPEPPRNVPRDVAVHSGNNGLAKVFPGANGVLRGNIQPGTGVVCLEREKQPASGRKHGHITSHGVVSVQHGSVKCIVGLRRRG